MGGVSEVSTKWSISGDERNPRRGRINNKGEKVKKSAEKDNCDLGLRFKEVYSTIAGFPLLGDPKNHCNKPEERTRRKEMKTLTLNFR